MKALAAVNSKCGDGPPSMMLRAAVALAILSSVTNVVPSSVDLTGTEIVAASDDGSFMQPFPISRDVFEFSNMTWNHKGGEDGPCKDDRSTYVDSAGNLHLRVTPHDVNGVREADPEFDWYCALATSVSSWTYGTYE